MQALMALIESPSFEGVVGVASDLRTMLRACEGQTSRELARAARLAPNQLRLAKRVLALCERDFDVRYQNPSDTAITVYLWILSMTSRSLARALATTVLGLRNGWWAPRLAREILSTRALGEEASSDTVVASPGRAFGINHRLERRDDQEIAAHGFARHLKEADGIVRVSRRSVGLPNADAVTIGGVSATKIETPTDDLAEVA